MVSVDEYVAATAMVDNDIFHCCRFLAGTLRAALCLLVFDDPVEFLAVCPNNKAGEAQRGWARRSMVR
jgi:hypothetical protein